MKDCSLPRSIFVNFWLKNSFNHFALKRQVVEHIKGYLMSLITFKFKVIFKDFYGIDVLPWLENIQTASQIKMSTQHSIEKIAFYGLARSTWLLQREIPAEILRSVSKCFFFSVTKFEWMDAFFRVVKILGVHSFIRNLWISWWPANEIKSRRELWHIPYPEALTDPTVRRPINRTAASAIIRIQFFKNLPSPPGGTCFILTTIYWF